MRVTQKLSACWKKSYPGRFKPSKRWIEGVIKKKKLFPRLSPTKRVLKTIFVCVVYAKRLETNENENKEKVDSIYFLFLSFSFSKHNGTIFPFPPTFYALSLSLTPTPTPDILTCGGDERGIDQLPIANSPICSARPPSVTPLPQNQVLGAALKGHHRITVCKKRILHFPLFSLVWWWASDEGGWQWHVWPVTVVLRWWKKHHLFSLQFGLGFRFDFVTFEF